MQENDVPSIEIGPTGTLKLYKSLAEYEFKNSGMVRNAMTSPLATGAAALQQSYQISENDVQVVKTLGQGATGLVQKAFWPSKGEFVAVKKISVLEREKRHQLMNDIKALCAIPDVPGLVRFRGAYHCADKGQIAVALEYMDGGSLADVLERVGPIQEDLLAAITKRVLQGLAWLHGHHTVHRDIKPANILMSTSGQPKVSDFGISAFVDNTLAQCHTFLGTVTYMSPERINGQPYSFPADVWALGLTLLECAMGKYPYDASGGTIQLMIQLMEDDPPLPKDGTFSTAFRDFIGLCLAKDPGQRPSAEELLRHPFIRKSPPADLRSFMTCMLDVQEKIHDVVMITSARFYNNLSFNLQADCDSIANFYDSEAILVSHSLGNPESTIRRLKGRYTIAAHWGELMMHLGEAVAFNVDEQSHKLTTQSCHDLKSLPESQEASMKREQPLKLPLKVVISQIVNIKGRAPRLDEIPEDLGSYEEKVTICIRNLDVLQPGVGFAILSHEICWTNSVIPRRALQGSSTSARCRQQ